MSQSRDIAGMITKQLLDRGLIAKAKSKKIEAEIQHVLSIEFYETEEDNKEEDNE